jgi:hypothetical protein
VSGLELRLVLGLELRLGSLTYSILMAEDVQRPLRQPSEGHILLYRGKQRVKHLVPGG